MKQKGPWLLRGFVYIYIYIYIYIGDEMLPRYIGIMINHYKDTY